VVVGWHLHSGEPCCCWRSKKGADGAAEPTDHALGRSRGGFGTKLHLLCDGRGLPLAARITAGQAHESTQFESILSAFFVRHPGRKRRWRPRRLAADKAYDVRRIRHWLARHGIRAVIPPKRHTGRRKRGRPVTYNAPHYRARNVVERCVGWLKEHRSVATRYEKLALNYLVMAQLAILKRYLRCLTSTPSPLSRSG
jgi:transposase